MVDAPRLRFAPSPTGSLHVGNARTAIVNWLEARRRGGALVLRIEDTDLDRNVEGATDRLLDDLRWLGLDWDEGPDVGGEHGPYLQSQRAERYSAALRELIGRESAYPCFCEPPQRSSGETPAQGDTQDITDHGVVVPVVEASSPGCMADCGSLPAAAAGSRVAAGEPAAYRYRFRAADLAGDFRMHDELRGELEVAADEIGDFVIVRRDGRPTYQFAVVVDDHDMSIDSVVRGQDHLTNTARQLSLYRAYGWEPPLSLHLPLLLGPDRRRLSKRHGAASVAEMRARGVLPEVLLNYLALLGWEVPGEQEVLTRAELVDVFDARALATSNAIFDDDKLAWLNQQHLARLTPEELLDRARGFLLQAGETPEQAPAWWREAVDLVRPRVRWLSEVAGALQPLLLRHLPTSSSASTSAALEAVRQEISESSTAPTTLRAFAAISAREALSEGDRFRAAAKAAGRESGARGRELFHPLRLALTLESDGPELARLVPLIERGSATESGVGIAGVGERIERILQDRG